MTNSWVEPVSRLWPGAVRALTTTRYDPAGRLGPGLGGWNLADHVGDRAAAVAASRAGLVAATGVQGVQWLAQVHGTRCVEARREDLGEAPEADAAWTCEPGLGLAVLTADCVPVVLAHRQGRVVAVAHAGWRGLVAGVLERTVAALPADPGDLVAWLGPAIGPGAYQVGEAVLSAVAALPEGGRLVDTCVLPTGEGRGYLDLFTLAECLLQRAGVKTVVCERLCTWSDERFFSYRRDGRTGRMVTLAWLT